MTNQRTTRYDLLGLQYDLLGLQYDLLRPTRIPPSVPYQGCSITNHNRHAFPRIIYWECSVIYCHHPPMYWDWTRCHRPTPY